MKIITHSITDTQIAEVTSDSIIINSTDDSLDLLGDIYFQGCDKLILHENNITSDFFNLKNGIAGEMLQKFSNYRVKLAIVGNFDKFSKKSINDFICESNNKGHIIFVASVEEALQKLSKLQ